jgi:hypothetical protein
MHVLCPALASISGWRRVSQGRMTDSRLEIGVVDLLISCHGLLGRKQEENAAGCRLSYLQHLILVLQLLSAALIIPDVFFVILTRWCLLCHLLLIAYPLVHPARPTIHHHLTDLDLTRRIDSHSWIRPLFSYLSWPACLLTCRLLLFGLLLGRWRRFLLFFLQLRSV